MACHRGPPRHDCKEADDLPARPRPTERHVILFITRYTKCCTVDFTGVDTRVDPAAASGGTIGLHLVEVIEWFACVWTCDVETVDFTKHCFSRRLAVLINRVVPRHVQ